LRGIAPILAATIAAELNNISDKDRSCNMCLRGLTKTFIVEESEPGDEPGSRFVLGMSSSRS
jgi:hypothetical protein